MQLPTHQKLGETTIEIDKIRLDGGTQPRAELNEEVAREYGEMMSSNGTAAFPPVTIYCDGTDYWLADGFHRVYGAKRYQIGHIRADIQQGTRRDAVLHSAGANAQHGLRRTNADKRRAVLTLLNDAEWSQWSDRQIAHRCGVDAKTVGNIRRELGREIPSLRQGADGKTYHMANIGHADTEPPIQAPLHLTGESGVEIPQVKQADVDTPNGSTIGLQEGRHDCRSDAEQSALAARNARYQVGRQAACRHCQRIYKVNDYIYDNWQPDTRPGIWRCPRGHRVADVLMQIVPDTLAPPRPSQSKDQEQAANAQPQAIELCPVEGLIDDKYYMIVPAGLASDDLQHQVVAGPFESIAEGEAYRSTQGGTEAVFWFETGREVKDFAHSVEGFRYPESSRALEVAAGADESVPGPMNKSEVFRRLNAEVALKCHYDRLKVRSRRTARRIMRLAFDYGVEAACQAALACWDLIKAEDRAACDLKAARREIELLHTIMRQSGIQPANGKPFLEGSCKSHESEQH